MSNSFLPRLKTEKLLEFVAKEGENNQSRRFIEIGFTLIVIAGFAFFALKPTFATISDLMGKIKSKRILVTEMSKKIGNIIKAQDNFANIQNEYPIIESCLPSRPAVFQATTQVRKSGEKFSVSFDRITFTFEEGDSYHLNVNTKGDFIAFLQTLGQLNRTRRPFTINSFSFSLPKMQSAAATSSADLVNFNLNTEYYYSEKTNESKQ